jgi:hypothetical protein
MLSQHPLHRELVGAAALAIVLLGATLTGCGDDGGEQAGTTAEPAQRHAEPPKDQSNRTSKTAENEQATRRTDGGKSDTESAKQGKSAERKPRGQETRGERNRTDQATLTRGNADTTEGASQGNTVGHPVEQGTSTQEATEATEGQREVDKHAAEQGTSPPGNTSEREDTG